MRQIVVFSESQIALHIRIEDTPIGLVVMKPNRTGDKVTPASISADPGWKTANLLVPDAPTAREILRLLAEAIRLAEEYNLAAGIDGNQVRYNRSAINHWDATK